MGAGATNGASCGSVKTFLFVKLLFSFGPNEFGAAAFALKGDFWHMLIEVV